MLNIELPWIDGEKLTRRWYPHVLSLERLDYEELHHCIFELGLPVYNYLKKLQEGIVGIFQVVSLCFLAKTKGQSISISSTYIVFLTKLQKRQTQRNKFALIKKRYHNVFEIISSFDK